MTNFKITVGYRAVINFDIKAENEADAKKIALEKLHPIRDKFNTRFSSLQGDTYNAYGALDMDNTWNML